MESLPSVVRYVVEEIVRPIQFGRVCPSTRDSRPKVIASDTPANVAGGLTSKVSSSVSSNSLQGNRLLVNTTDSSHEMCVRDLWLPIESRRQVYKQEG